MPSLRLTPEEALDVRITVRLTAAQAAKLDELKAATGKSEGAIIRALLERTPALRPLPPARSLFDQQAVSQLSKLGVNLNQIARELNRRERMGVSAEEISKIDRALLQIIAATIGGPEEAAGVVTKGLSEVIPGYVPRRHGPSEADLPLPGV